MVIEVRTGGLKKFVYDKYHKNYKPLSKREQNEIKKPYKLAKKRKKKEEKQLKESRKREYNRKKNWAIFYFILTLITAILGYVHNYLFYYTSVILGICVFVWIYRAYKFGKKLQ